MLDCIHDRKELEECSRTASAYVQHFYYAPIAKNYGSDVASLELVDNNVLTKEDIHLIHFLYRARMADMDQLLARFPEYGTKEHMHDTLKFLMKKRLINCFAYLAPGMGRMPDDAYRIYLFDFASISLLSHFYPDEDVWNWNYRTAKVPMEVVRKELLATDFRIAMETKLDRPPVSYDSYPLMFFGRFRLQPAAITRLSSRAEDGTAEEIPYIVLAFTETDMGNSFSAQVTETLGRYEEFYDRQSWKTYFSQAPGVFIVCDTEPTAVFIESIMQQIVEHENRPRTDYNPKAESPFSKNVRITYKDRFTDNLETAMYKFSEEKQSWIRVRTALLKEAEKD